MYGYNAGGVQCMAIMLVVCNVWLMLAASLAYQFELCMYN